MTYDANTPLMGRGVLTAAGIDAAFAERGHAPPGLGAIIVQEADAIGLNHDFLASQVGDETNWWRSDDAVLRNNPSGFGHTDNAPSGMVFPTIAAGLKATVAHWLTYIMGDSNPLAADDPRFALVPANHRGTVHTVGDIGSGVWASSPTYSATIARIMNELVPGVTPPQPGGTPVRIIVHAGHQNIGSITSDPNGAIDPTALRGGTGANGEMQWNVVCATELTRLLKAAGADAVQTDAIYHPDVYGPDADLVFAIHYDGGGGTGHPQYCMAATVHSGPSTEAADSLADQCVRAWYAAYPAAMGIPGTGPITVDMTQYYGGWYRSTNTPMLLAEHCLGADAAGIRSDRPLATVAAAADFAVLAKHFGLGTTPTPPPPDVLNINGHVVGGAFRRLWESTPYPLQAFGYPLDEEHQADVTTPAPDGIDAHAETVRRTVQTFERSIFLYFPEHPAPWDVSTAMLTQIVGG